MVNIRLVNVVKKRVIVIKEKEYIIFGEVLYDCFPNGDKVPGGAPFNIAWGLRGFGYSPTLVSAVGNDNDGTELLEQIRSWGLDDSELQIDTAHQTGSVSVSLSDEEARYEIDAPRAWDFIRDNSLKAGHLLYHGSLALRSPASYETFTSLLKRSADAIRFFDVNLRPPHYTLESVKDLMRGVEWLKLNLDELQEITGRSEIKMENAAEVLEQLQADFGIGNILLTGGSQGAIIRGADELVAKIPAPSPGSVIDTVGAGDGFTVVTLRGILKGLPLKQIVDEASTFAAKICQMRGAISPDPEFYRIL